MSTWEKTDAATRKHLLAWTKAQFRNYEVAYGWMLEWVEDHEDRDEVDYAVNLGWPAVWRAVAAKNPAAWDAVNE